MAIETLKSEELTMTTGKGSKKRDLVIMNYSHSIAHADLLPALGNHITKKYSPGSSTDTPFGLRPVSMELTLVRATAVSNNYGVAVMSVSSHEVTTSLNSGLLSGVGIYEANFVTDPGGLFPNEMMTMKNERRVFDPDTTRILTMPELYLSASVFCEDGADVWVSQRYVFEKIKLTKNEYMEKLIRNI